MIKVFTTNQTPDKAGDYLTDIIAKWISGFERGIEIISVHNHSNKFGWMVIIHYKPN